MSLILALSASLTLVWVLSFLAVATHFYEYWTSGSTRGPRTKIPPPPAAWPLVSLHVPIHNEPVNVVENTLLSLRRLDYSNFEVLVIDNNTVDEQLWRPVQKLCEQLGFKFFHLENWPGYKAGALNFALSHTEQNAAFVGVIDSDYQVEPNFIKECLPHFEDDAEIAYVQPPQDHYFCSNRMYQSCLYYAYRQFFDVSLTARNRSRTTIPVGTMTLIKKHALVVCGGWDEHTITEDAELGMRFAVRGLSGRYLALSKGRGLMPFQYKDLRRQRFRWAYGGIQTFLKYRSHILWQSKNPAERNLSFRQRIGYFVLAFHWLESGLFVMSSVLLVSTCNLISLGLIIESIKFLVLLSYFSIALSFLNFIAFVLTARVRSGCSFATATGAFFILLSLTWPVALACFKAIFFSRSGSFERTPKYFSGLPSSAGYVVLLRSEILLAILCLFSAIGLYSKVGATESSIVLSLCCVVQAMCYLSSVTIALCERFGRGAKRAAD